MTKSNVNATKLAVIAVAIAVIGTSTMFIFRSRASLRSDPKPTASTPLDMREAVSRDIIANDTGLADRVRERFSSQEDVDALSPHQFELLAEQFGTVLGAHAGGTLDDDAWNPRLQIPELFTRFGDRLDDLRTRYGLELLQLFLEPGVTLGGHRNLIVHALRTTS